MGPERVDPRVECGVRSHERFERHGASDVGQAREARRIEDREGAVPGHEVRAVEEREPFLRLEDEGAHARAGQRLGGGNLPVAVRYRAVAEETECHVSERRQISRRPDRPQLGHDGMDAPVQARDHRFDDRGPHSGRAARQGGGKQEHDRSHVRLREGRAHAPGVAQDEVPLEVGTRAWWNDDVLELPDAGRDSVDCLRARRQPIDEGAAGAQGLLRTRGQRNLLTPAGDRFDGLERERPAV